MSSEPIRDPLKDDLLTLQTIVHIRYVYTGTGARSPLQIRAMHH